MDWPIDGLTPLFYAVIGGHLDHVRALLAQGADVDGVTKINDPEKTIVKGATSLLYACWFGRSRDGSAESVAADPQFALLGCAAPVGTTESGPPRSGSCGRPSLWAVFPTLHTPDAIEV